MTTKTRREFLQSVSHGVLPAFAVLGLGISLGGCGDEGEKSCKDCSGSCEDSCSGTSSGSSPDPNDCGGSCSALCADGCPGACGDACATSCTTGCWGSGI